MKWTVGTKIGAGFAIALIINVAVGVFSYHSTSTLTETAQWVIHTHEVMEELSAIIQALTDAETGQRGYIITSEEPYLEPYRTGISSVNRATKSVRHLTQDNAHQQRRLDALEPLINQRLATLKEGIDALESRGSEAGRQWILSGKGRQEMDDLRDLIGEMRTEAVSLLKERSDIAKSTAENAQLTNIIGTISAFIVMALAGYFITRNICERLREITLVARKTAEGDLRGIDLSTSSRDEIGDLATTFTTMRGNLKEMASQIRQATENVSSTAAEVLASTQQQAAATKEQAATVQEITTTIEEINQSGAQIAERAKQVSSTVEATTSATVVGKKATQEVSRTMDTIRNQVEEVAENIVSLSERTQTIGEIVATVSEIAEQSNLLALNASIEAVAAGEQGGRFSVVAHEMKNLADRAKECTSQVRTILGEIQKGINTSVLLAEEAVKRVDNGKQQTDSTEETIRKLSDTTERSIQAFEQILGGTNQQQLGVAQVTQGMQDIRQAVTQTAAGTAQLEKAAASLNALNQQLRTAVARYSI